MIYEFAQSTFLHAPDLMMVKDNVAGWEKEEKRMVRLENRFCREFLIKINCHPKQSEGPV